MEVIYLKSTEMLLTGRYTSQNLNEVLCINVAQEAAKLLEYEVGDAEKKLSVYPCKHSKMQG